MIGVSFGAPTEFRYLGKIIPEDKLPKWKPDMVSEALRQDDLYVDMTLAKVLDEKVLPEKKIDQPVSGLLYFPMEQQKMKDLELVYGGKEKPQPLVRRTITWPVRPS